MPLQPRTARISSGITESLQPLSDLFGSARAGNPRSTDPNIFEDVLLKNTGNTTLSVAVLWEADAPTAADAISLEAGETLPLSRIHVDYCYIATTDDAGTNEFEFIGDAGGDF